MLRIDLEFGGDLCLEIARLLKEAHQQLAVMLNFSCVVWRLTDVVGHLHEPGVGETLGSRKLKNTVVDRRLDNE